MCKMENSNTIDMDKDENGEGPQPRKIRRNLSSMINSMKMTEEEISYRTENFDHVNIVEEYQTYLKCTKCDMEFQEKINRGEEVGIHPLLLVLMCDSCRDYYGDGNFSLDSEGEDKYCRWCGEGGTIFSCSKCICGFCDICIKKHFGEDELKRVESDDDWTCYFCNPKPLWDLRSICSLAWQASKNKKEQLGKITVKLRKRKKYRKSFEKDNDKSLSSDSSYSIVNEKEGSKKRIKYTKSRNNSERDPSSSSEDDKENSIKRKKQPRMKKKSLEKDTTESDFAVKKKPKVNSDPTFENKKTVVLNKLKSIWKLTQTIASVGLSLSRKRLKQLEQSDSFKNLEDLQTEHYDLRSFTTTLVSSLKSAASSIDSITEDLSVDVATDETEIFQAQEREIKRLAKKLEGKPNSEISTDSDDSSKSESKEKTNKSKQPEIQNQKEEKKEKMGDEKSRELSENSKSAFSDSKCDGVKENENNANKEAEKREISEPRRPLLRVKAFARMLDENLLDKKKEDKTVEVYDIESDKSGDECQKKLSDEKTSNSDGIEKIQNNDALVKEPCNGTLAKVTPKNNKQKSKKKGESDESSKKQLKKEFSENTSDFEMVKKKDDQFVGKENEEIVKSKNAEIQEKNSAEDEVLANRLVNKGSVGLSNDKNAGKKTNDRESGKKKQKSDQESSGGESVVAKKRKKKQKDSDSSDEELTVRKTRSQKKLNQTPAKGLFEKFKQKREDFIKNRKESLQNRKSKEVKPISAELEDSEKEENHKNVKPKKKLIIDSSEEEEQKNKTEKEAEESEEKAATSTDESEAEVIKRQVRRKKKNSDSSAEEIKKDKTKRKNSSDSSEEEQNKRKGRRNIKKILKKDSLKVETKEALKNEEARRKRVKERQKLFEKLFPKDDGKIILDFDPEKKKPVVMVHKKLAKKLKPHQVKGVKFMWDNCFESVQRLEEDSGSGCILAHCMGLGKTLQVVTLVHTVMTHDLGVNTILIVCPLSTISNWIREFESWLADINTEPIILFDLVKYKKKEERGFHLKDWHENGGVLVISYDLFRILTKSGTRKERRTKFKQTVFKALLDPGPDLVICDEGHLLKNEETALSKCMSQIKTSRRIVLTGTPLQNNLVEYHCMVQFVKPNILGTKKEFCNRFVNPINNGQFEDSTEFDVKIMKRRSHVLHSMLEGCIQRFDYSVLTPFLPEKHEYVVSVSLTEKQAKAYQHFISSLSAKSQGSLKGRALFHDYHNLQRIWTHPRVLLMQSERETEKEFVKDEEDSLEDFIVSSGDESETQKSGSSDSVEVQPKKRILRSNANDPDVIRAMQEEEEKSQTKHWWDEFFHEETFDNLKESNKLILLFSLLKHCKKINDKILVFSQSLYSLDLIEHFLNEINDSGKKNSERLCGYSDTWHLGTDYFRLDGSTSSDQRASWCKYFNKESNTRARLFLISTRAGGLGINLYGANRVIIFDASWNPSHDLQSIFRVYRFGQKKPCYIYRFLAEGTMEEKIYERQVTKLSLAHRVVDEHQIERHYTMGNLLELYEFKPTEERSVPIVPKDSILADLLQEYKDIIVGYHEHDSLLENKEEEELTEEERKAAWKEYEEEKERKMTIDSNMQQQQQYLFQLQQVYPNQPIRVLNPAYMNMNLNQAFTNPMSSLPLAHKDKELDKYPLWLEVIRRFIRSSEFETPFGLKLLAFTLNEIVQNNEISSLSLNLPKEVLKREATESGNQDTQKQRAEDSGDSDGEDKVSITLNTTASNSEDVENIKTDGYGKKLTENLNDNFYKSSNSVPSSSLTEKRNSEDSELDRLLRLASVKPVTLKSVKHNCTEQKETLENAEVKYKPQEKEEPQTEPQSGEPKLSLLDCFSSQDNEESGELVTRQIKEDDFVKQFNIEVKNLFLHSSESCPSDVSQSEKEEEIQMDEKNKEKRVLKKALQNRKRRKNDLRKYRLSISEDEMEKSVKPSKKKEQKQKITPEKENLLEEEKEGPKEGDCDIISDSENSVEVVMQPSDSDSEIVQIDEVPQKSLPIKGRKNINKILDVRNLQQETKAALKMEIERKRRLKERQELINKTFEGTKQSSKLVLDFDPATMQELVVVDENLSKHLKPHQREGVKFMWNCCFESLGRIKEEKGSGCVLAHCMGLGKTLQVIALIHSVLTHSPHLRTVLIMCPLITLRNWFHEFEIWMKDCNKPIKPFDLGTARNKKIGQMLLWMERGGVLITSYEMFRTLVKKDTYSKYRVCLLDPGPDIMICDEGHLMKNPNSGLSKCVSGVRTLRRIVLTGTPLQNNLIEYYSMVQFVKPNLLGTKKEFMNRFVNPITNGQFENSTQKDVFIMKQRSHVLHTLLQSFVQRLGYDVLEPLLPRKQEFVILIALTDTQEKLYNLCIKKPLKEGHGLLWDFHWYHKVWTHPLVIRRYFEQNNVGEDLRQSWEKFIPEYEYGSIRSSNKLRLFFSILQKCRQVGDKLLVFSQSLYTIGLIEYFLLKLNRDNEEGNHSEFADVWTLGRDYFKLTGLTKPEDREVYYERFSSSRRACLFLISTKAGGLGINLVAANRVVLFDASWNPAHDLQSIFRVYRFGQKKPCYIYRFLAAATMEEKIYNRQITKLSLAHRILDEHQIERHYSSHNLLELYTYNPLPKSEWKVPKIPKDQIFAEILSNNRDIIVGYHEHNSLLANKEEEELTEEERQAAWENYEKEKATPKKDFSNRDFWSTVHRPSHELISKYKISSAKILEAASYIGHEYQTKLTSVSLNRYPNGT